MRKKIASVESSATVRSTVDSTLRVAAVKSDGKGGTPPVNEYAHARAMSFDAVSLHWMWRETNSLLDHYTRRAVEGIELEAGAKFARYVRFAGIVKLFKEHAAGEPLTVDGALIDWKANELEKAVCEKWRSGAVPQSRDTQLEVIDHKLNLIAGQLAKVQLAPAAAESNVIPFQSAARR